MSRPTLPHLVTVVVAVVATLCSCLTVSAQAPAARTVLAIHWGPESFPATPIVNGAIRAALLAEPALPVDYFVEYLESDRLPAEQASQALHNYIRQKFRGRRIDLVVAVADPAFRFALDHRDALFPGVPILYSGVAIPDGVSRSAGGGFTAVMRGVAYRETLKLVLDLHPSTQRVFVVAQNRDERTVQSVQEELTEFERRVALTYVRAATLPELLATVKAIPPRSVILFIWHQQNDPGRVMYSNEVARLIVQASGVPVYGTNDSYIGSGVVGGVARNTIETATRMGEMARQILSGTPPQDIPIENARLMQIFDWHEMRRWDIDPSRLSPEAEIRFREPTLWESNRNYILVTVIVMVAQLVLITGLLTQRARLRRAAITLREREATLRTSYERSQQLARRLINAQEAARADIARDLHDDLCQELVGVSIAVSNLKRLSGDLQDEQAQHALATLHLHTLGMVDGVRRLSHELHPTTLRLVGLAAALGAHCIEVEKRYDVQVSFKMAGDLVDIHAGIALCLFRIAQEALRNGAVHGEARRLAVSIARSRDSIELVVSDDGRGFDLDAVRRDGRGLGLVSIEERTRALGGDVQIVARQRYGTFIRVRIPLEASADTEKDELRVPMRPLVQHIVSNSTEPL
jgi:signal transduction histidine kinase